MSIISAGTQVTLLGIMLVTQGCAVAVVEPGDPGCEVNDDCPDYARCHLGGCVRGAREGADGGPEADRGEVIEVHDAAGVEPDAERSTPDVGDAASSNDGNAHCVAGEVRSCGINLGLCRLGEERCGEDGQWAPCTGGVMPTDEVCNGGDDDCDGAVDEAFALGTACDGEGECGAGVVECAGGAQTRCSTGPRGSASEAVDERCNGLDDDCDGAADDGYGLGVPCGGACGPGVIECNAAEEAQCSTDTGGSDGGAAEERCDQRDNDCDGVTDEGFRVGTVCEAPGRCGAGVLECDEVGAARCSVGAEGSASRARAEVCDGADDDCDDRVDEELGLGMPCPLDAECGVGAWRCGAEGGLECVAEGGAAEPAEEMCNGRDDDCDDIIDEASCGGDACGESIPLISVRTVLGDTRFLADDQGRANCLGNVRGPDQFFSIQVPAVGRYVVGVAPIDGEFDPLFWVAPDCDRASNCLVADAGQDDDGRGRPEAAAILFPRAGRFTVVVDGRDEGERGPFAVTFSPAGAGETCDAAIALPVPGRFVGTTARSSADISARACPAAAPTAGPDQVFRLELDAPTMVTATLVPASGVRATLFLTGDCGRPDDDCRAGSTARAAGAEVRVSARLPVGVTYVVVDHPVGGQGPFSLTISTGE